MKQNSIELVFVPGGPGLGSNSFFPLKNHLDNANLFFYSFKKNLKSKQKISYNYDAQLEDLESVIRSLKNPILVGHSFGGILSTHALVRRHSNIRGLVCLATPFSEKSFQFASEAFRNFQMMQSEIQKEKKIDEKFKENPTNKNFKKWFAHYSDLYFENEKTNGKKLLLCDNVCSKAFIEARSEASNKQPILQNCFNLRIPKLFIAGANDRLFPESLLKFDASLGGFDYVSVNNAGHFVHFDQPKTVSSIISDFFDVKDKFEL